MAILKANNSFLKSNGKILMKSSSTDQVTIGGRSYPIVKIGNQLWMAENLDYKFDGLVVGGDMSSTEPRANYYNNDEATYGINGNKYGLLYNWTALKKLATDAATLLPRGWHVPNQSEWNNLIAAVGGSSVAGTKLKSTTGWAEGRNGDGSYGFEAFPAGYRNYAGGFENVGYDVYITGIKNSAMVEGSALYLNYWFASATVSYRNTESMNPIRLVYSVT